MFFISDSLAKTFQSTIMDLLYHNKNREIRVLLNPKDYQELVFRTFDIKDQFLFKGIPKEKRWDYRDAKVNFFTSLEMERGTIYIFQDHQITTVNLIQKQDGEEKNTLPGS